MRVVLVRESDAVGFCSEAELPSVTRERGHPAAGLDRNRRLELLDLEELLPCLLGVDALGHNLHTVAPRLGEQHADGLIEVRPLEHGPGYKLAYDLVGIHSRSSAGVLRSRTDLGPETRCPRSLRRRAP